MPSVLSAPPTRTSITKLLPISQIPPSHSKTLASTPSLPFFFFLCKTQTATASMPSSTLVFLLVTLAVAFDASDAAWCVCRSDASTSDLQKTLDYACGSGADCSPLLQNGACYNPNTVLAHCSYAANSYYQRKGQTQDACNFTGTATTTTTDPGGNGCTYPATPSAAGSSTSTGTLTNSTATPSTFTPTTGTTLGGLGPSGTTSFDGSDGGLHPNKGKASLLLLAVLVISPLVLLGI